MDFRRRQNTIAGKAVVKGFGFWSGQDTSIEFRPAGENTGLVFVRADLPGKPRIQALLRNRIPGPRRTTLCRNGVCVEMVEHVLAALAGLQIDNCEIWIDGPEVPGVDGSCQPFVAALQQAGSCQQNAWRPVVAVNQPLRVEAGDGWIEARPASNRNFRLRYELSYTIGAIGAQAYASDINPESFISRIASARTFLLESEANDLQQQGLGMRVTYQDVLVFNEAGAIGNQLRFPDECARHKVLDMVGDFALLGMDLVGEFTASRSGHELNSQMVAVLESQNNLYRNRKSA